MTRTKTLLLKLFVLCCAVLTFFTHYQARSFYLVWLVGLIAVLIDTGNYIHRMKAKPGRSNFLEKDKPFIAPITYRAAVFAVWSVFVLVLVWMWLMNTGMVNASGDFFLINIFVGGFLLFVLARFILIQFDKRKRFK